MPVHGLGDGLEPESECVAVENWLLLMTRMPDSTYSVTLIRNYSVPRSTK